LLNRNKTADRKNKIIFIHAAKDYLEGKNRNKLRPLDIDKITKAFKDHKDIDRYCHISELDEMRENEYNLNVPRYVDISEPEDEVDIQQSINALSRLENERASISSDLKKKLVELGFRT
jgi:type I restriction enzyme M protein